MMGRYMSSYYQSHIQQYGPWSTAVAPPVYVRGAWLRLSRGNIFGAVDESQPLWFGMMEAAG